MKISPQKVENRVGIHQIISEIGGGVWMRSGNNKWDWMGSELGVVWMRCLKIGGESVFLD